MKFLSVNVICHILPQYLSTCSAGDSFEEEPGTGERFQIVGTVISKDEKRRRFALEEYSVSFHRKKAAQKIWHGSQIQLYAKNLATPALITHNL